MSVVERLQYLLDTGQFADVNIRVGSGSSVTVFKAHRLLLATASQSLYKMVYAVNPSPGPNDVTTIRVTDMKASDFKNILKYIYTDTIDCSNINVAFEMLRASKKWGLAGLGIKSLTYLEEFIDDFRPTSEDMKTNLFDLLKLCEQTLNDMYEKCWQIVVKYCNEVIPCEGFLNLDKPTINKIITHDGLKFEDQLKLFEAIRDWGLRYINHKNLQMSQLGDVVEDLIQAVDFEKIEDNDFVTTVLTSECLGKAEVIAFFMTHGLEIPRNLDFNNNKQLPFWLMHCVTSGSESEGGNKMGSRRESEIMSTVNDISPTILKNENKSAFQKVCRFRKGYQCPVTEIYQPHELRFRVSKNIKLLGVGFGFLFSCTDMGITIHCQGPWERRQWTDITQTYCRVSGEKQEAADVRLMFSEPVRIEANHSYKVLVKIGRMSSGSSDVELWGGTGAQYTIETKDANFFFIKAAVDPNKNVEEGEGDTTPGIITELLYNIDLEEYDKDDMKTEVVTRRRRPQVEDEESNQLPSETSPWRKRYRASDVTLQIPDTTRVRRRENTSESTLYSTKKSPVEEYKPMSFSTNRWRTKGRDDESESIKTPPVDEYKPSSFSTNRWRTGRTRDEDTADEYKPSSFSTNRWRGKEDDSSTITNKANEEYKPSSFATNRWRTKSREEESDTKNTLDTSPYSSRKTSAEEKQESYSSNRWRTKSREEAPPVKIELRKTIGVDDNKSSSSLPFLRRRESTENKTSDLPFMRRRESTETKTPEMPAYLRKRSNLVEESKTATPFGRSRWGTSTTTANSDEGRLRDTTTRSRFLNKDTSSTSSTRPSESLSLRTRDTSSTRYSSTRDPSLTRTQDSTSLSRPTDTSYSRTRDSSLSRTRETPSYSRMRDSSSTSRFGPSSTSSYGSSYLNRYDKCTAEGTDTGSSSISSRYGSSASTGSSQKRYTGAGSDSTLCGSRYGSSYSNAATDLGTSGRYSSLASRGANDLGSSSKYGSSTSTGVKNLGSSSRYGGSSYSSGVNDLSSSNRYGSITSTKPSDFGSSSKYSSSASTGGTDVGSSSRLSSYSSPFSTRDTDSTSKSISSRYGSSSAMAPGSTSYDSRSSGKWGTDKGTNKYGSDSSASSKYGSTSNKYGSSSSRY